MNRLFIGEASEAMAAQLFSLDKELSKGIFSVVELGDVIPLGLFINSQRGENLYMNIQWQRLIGYTSEEIRELGEEYVEAIQYDKTEG